MRYQIDEDTGIETDEGTRLNLVSSGNNLYELVTNAVCLELDDNCETHGEDGIFDLTEREQVICFRIIEDYLYNYVMKDAQNMLKMS